MTCSALLAAAAKNSSFSFWAAFGLLNWECVGSATRGGGLFLVLALPKPFLSEDEASGGEINELVDELVEMGGDGDEDEVESYKFLRLSGGLSEPE